MNVRIKAESKDIVEDIMPPSHDESALFHQSPVKSDKTSDTSLISEDERLRKNVATLLEICKDPFVKTLRVPNVNRQLEDIIRQCEAVRTLPTSKLNMEPIKPEEEWKFAPNEKLDRQWQPSKFFKTKKPIQKKKNCNRRNIKEKLNATTLPPTQSFQLTTIASTTSTTPIIPRLGKIALSDTLLSFEGVNILYKSLLSIEISFNQYELKEIKKEAPRFQSGWLNDEIIDGFLYKLKKYIKNDLLWMY